MVCDAAKDFLKHLVMVAAEEKIVCVSEFVVISYHLRGEMAMVVDDGQVLYEVVEFPCRFRAEHKVIVYKTHKKNPFLRFLLLYTLPPF